MSLQTIKDAVANKKMICPKCNKPIQKFDKYAETIDAVRDGFNVQEIDSNSSRVTLICSNEGCDWKERTEYWHEYISQ
jgi:DNA integrity scanning protein DisA with diadenylate cyclase activity